MPFISFASHFIYVAVNFVVAYSRIYHSIMSESNEPSQPCNLDDIHDELFAGADFLPDEVKNQFLAGVVEGSISRGCAQYIHHWHLAASKADSQDC